MKKSSSCGLPASSECAREASCEPRAFPEGLPFECGCGLASPTPCKPLQIEQALGFRWVTVHRVLLGLRGSVADTKKPAAWLPSMPDHAPSFARAFAQARPSGRPEELDPRRRRKEFLLSKRIVVRSGDDCRCRAKSSPPPRTMPVPASGSGVRKWRGQGRCGTRTGKR